MEEDNIKLECDTCGGKDFTKEWGYFYCNDCQTQSQHVKEQVFEPFQTGGNSFRATSGLQNASLTTKKLSTAKIKKDTRKLTSWECYNIILINLTEELLRLGANPLLKKVVQFLWLKYLNLSEIINLDADEPPKFSLLGSKKDISFLYDINLKEKRIRIRPSVAKDPKRREMNRKKRELIKSQLLDLSKTESSIHDATAELDDIKIKPELDSEHLFNFNEQSEEQLKNFIEKNGLDKSLADFKRDLKSLNFRRADFSSSYCNSLTKLSPPILYSILYIALLIIEDYRFQLGDLLRFIREGHVTYNSYQNCFNDSYFSDCQLNLPKVQEHLLASEAFRKRTLKLVQFLDIFQYIKTPNLVNLCGCFCKELNLPKHIFHLAEKLIVKHDPKMMLSNRSVKIPNYEARAISFIIFILKLLFCLDGMTEKNLSDYAVKLNSLNENYSMFNFMEWLQYIVYRQKAVRKYHLPTSLQNDEKTIDSNTYLNHVNNANIKYRSVETKMVYEMKDYARILNELIEKDNLNSLWPYLEFPPSFTPFLTYSKAICESNSDSVRKKILLRDFSNDSIDFLLRSHKYLSLFRNKSIKNGGANDKIIVEHLLNYAKIKIKKKNSTNKEIAVELVDGDDKFIQEFFDADEPKSAPSAADAENLVKNWIENNLESFTSNRIKLEKKMDKKNKKRPSHMDEMNLEYFNCFERYWLNVPVDPTQIELTRADMDVLLPKMPFCLRKILAECSRIVEQSITEIYTEFLLTELYLTQNQEEHFISTDWKKIMRNCIEKW